MKRLLFNFSNITQLNEQLKLVEVLKTKYSQCEIVFLVNEYNGVFNIEQIFKSIQEAGCTYLLSKNILVSQKRSWYVSLLYRLPTFLISYINKQTGYNFALLKSKLANTNWQLSTYKKFITSLNPDILIVSEDGVGSNIHLIKSAKNCGLNVMILPYEYSSEKQLRIGASSRFVYEENITGLSKEDFEKYYFKENNKYSGFYSKEEVYSYIESGVMPPNVKTVHGGLADKIAAESNSMANHYLNEGLSKNKVVCTGSVNDDVLFSLLKQKKEIKQKICNTLGFEASKPLIVFSFIPEYPNNIMFGNYPNYVKSVSNTLSQLVEYNIVYQFHPAVPQEHRDIANKYSLKISNIPTIELISVADLYITSYSSTIRWAIAASVPVLNLDLYNFDYDDFKSCKGVILVNREKEFEMVISQIKNAPDFYKELKENQGMEAGSWGKLDGKSGERIINLIDSLCR